jgi:hypothetical protein
MNKILRFTLVVALAVVSSLSFAQTTVSFVAGTDLGSADDPGNHGADKVVKDGITISTSDGIFAHKYNGKPGGEYRVYKNAIFSVSSTVGNITKIVVTCSAKGKLNYGPGNLTEPNVGTYTFEADGKSGTWTGTSSSVTFAKAPRQARITHVEVTYTPGAVTPPPAPEVTPSTPTDTTKLTVPEAIEKVSNDHSFKQQVCVTGIVSKIGEVSEKFGNATFYISADGTENNQLEVFRSKYLENKKFESADQIKVGDKVKVYGELSFYAKKNLIQLGKGHLVEINNVTTDINAVENNAKANDVMYNLAGQRVSKNYKGVVIVNGKKYMNK